MDHELSRVITSYHSSLVNYRRGRVARGTARVGGRGGKRSRPIPTRSHPPKAISLSKNHSTYHVQGLLLAPDDFRVRVSPDLAANQIERERRQLLKPDDGDLLFKAALLSLRVNFVIYLLKTVMGDGE